MTIPSRLRPLSPLQVAHEIARCTGMQVHTFPVRMVGTQAVARFMRTVQSAARSTERMGRLVRS